MPKLIVEIEVAGLDGDIGSGWETIEGGRVAVDEVFVPNWDEDDSYLVFKLVEVRDA